MNKEEIEEFLCKLFHKAVADVRSLNLEATDFEDTFRAGITMGRYWTMCDIMSIDGLEYAKKHGIEIVDF